jgi:hypothetical protein
LNKVQHLRILSEFSCGKPDPQMATDELTVLPTADCGCTQCPRTAERRRMAAKAAHPHPMCTTVVPRVVEWSGPAFDIAQPPPPQYQSGTCAPHRATEPKERACGTWMPSQPRSLPVCASRGRRCHCSSQSASSACPTVRPTRGCVAHGERV